MTELGTTWERDDLGGGRFRHTQHIKPVAFDDNGTMRRIVSAWANSGVTARPHIVTAARLMTSVADDGLRRIHPTREADRYIELGTPYVKVGGVWRKVGFKSATRTANSITWHRSQADLRVTHAGHYIKLDIELLGGYVPEGNLVAFPVGISGLTRSGGRILADGVEVMHLRAPVMTDADNTDDVRPIAFKFTNLAGQPYLVLTLPSLTGMSRPVIDPTLTLQPDADAGIDTFLRDGTYAATNNGTNTGLYVKEGDTALSYRRRSLVAFSLASIPAGATISSATLTFYWGDGQTYDGDVTITVYRCLRGWVESEATWDIYSTGNNWGTAGCLNTSTDFVNTALANYTLAGSKGTGDALVFTSETALLTYLTTVIGSTANFVLGSSNAKNFQVCSSDFATAGYRPKLVIDYTEAGGCPRQFMYYQRRRRG